jgi:pilus assembly protein CpaE
MSIAVTGLLKPKKQEARPLAAFVTDAASEATLRQAAGELNLADALLVRGTIDEAEARLRRMPTPKLLIVDLSGAPDPLAGLGGLAEVCDEGTNVLAVGEQNDIALYRSLLSLGVRDYLVKPLSTDEMKAAISRATDAGNGDPKAANRGKLIVVTGARGGVGATSVAVNIAWLIANEHNRRVALVDLDIFFGTCGLALDLEIGRGFREALENPSRIDALFIERAMAREGENLFVLSSEEPLDQHAMPDHSAVEVLIDHLRLDFPFVVVDLPRFAARTQMFALSPPASLVIVSDPTLAGVRDTARLAELAKKVASNYELVLTLNRVGAFAGGELGRSDFEKSAEAKVAAVVPFEPKPFAASAAAGKALASIASQARPTRALRDLATQLAGQARRDRSRQRRWPWGKK